jgi:hypothetical protein
MADDKGTVAAKATEPSDAEKAAKKAEREAAKVAAFKKTGNRRFLNILAAVDSFGSCSNRQNYSYTPEQIAKARKMLDDSLTNVWARFAPGAKAAESSGGIFDDAPVVQNPPAQA